MSFQSLAFFGFLATALAVCLTAGRRSPRAGAAMLAAASAVFCLLGPGGWTVVLGGVACLLAGICVTDAVFTFVAVGKDGKSRAIPRESNLELERALASIEELQLNC